MQHEIPVTKLDESFGLPKDQRDDRDGDHRQVAQKGLFSNDQHIESGTPAHEGREDLLDATKQFQAMHPASDMPATARAAQVSSLNSRLQAEAGSGSPSAQPFEVRVGDKTFTGVLSGPRQGQQPELMVPGKTPQRFVVDTADNQVLLHPINKDGSLGVPFKADSLRPAADAFAAHQSGAPVKVSELQQRSDAADGAKFYSDYRNANPADRARLAESFANNPSRDALARGMQEAAQRDPEAKHVLDSLTRDVQAAREGPPRVEQPAVARKAERAPEADRPAETPPSHVAQSEAIRQENALQQRQEAPDARLREREFAGSSETASPERVVSRVETTVASTQGTRPSSADIQHVAMTNSTDGRVQQILLQGRATAFSQAQEGQHVELSAGRAQALSEQALRGHELATNQPARTEPNLPGAKGNELANNLAGRAEANLTGAKGRELTEQAALKGRVQDNVNSRLDTRVLPNQLNQRIQELVGKGTLLSAVASRVTEVRPSTNAFDALRNAQMGERGTERIPQIEANQAFAPGTRAGGDRPVTPGLNMQDTHDRQVVAEAIKQLLALRLPEFNPRMHDVRTLLQGLDAGKIGKLQEFLTNEAAGTRTGALTQQQFIGRLNDMLNPAQERAPNISQTMTERMPLDAAFVAALRGCSSRADYLVNLAEISNRMGKAQVTEGGGLKQVIGRALGEGAVGLGTVPISREQMQSIRDHLVSNKPQDAKDDAAARRQESERHSEREQEHKAREEKETVKDKDESKEDGGDRSQPARKSETLKVKENEALLAELRAKKLREQKEREMRDRELALAQIRKNEENTRRRRYIVRDRDTLQSIALRQLRDVRLADLIYQINKSVIPIQTQRGKKVHVLKVGQVILLPSGNEVKAFKSRQTGFAPEPGTQEREMSAEEELEQLQEEEKFESVEDELAAKFGANWDGQGEEDKSQPEDDSSPKVASAAIIRVGKFGRSMSTRSEAHQPAPPDSVETIEAKIRRENVEELLGPVSKKKEVEQGRIKYVVRLGDTLKSICVKHPALQDVSLWLLVARINNLDNDTEAGAQASRLTRGAALMLPTPTEIAEFRAAVRSSGFTATARGEQVRERKVPKCFLCENPVPTPGTICSACRSNPGQAKPGEITRPVPPPQPVQQTPAETTYPRPILKPITPRPPAPGQSASDPRRRDAVPPAPSAQNDPDAATIIMQAAGFMFDEDDEDKPQGRV